MSTVLSVNLNKIALLRNSRGRDFPSVVEFAKKTINLGVKGLTIHPRPDERHIRRQDARDLAKLVAKSEVELNIEGFPNDHFMTLIQETQPDQVTLVPDGERQITSDHGWDLHNDLTLVKKSCELLRPHAGRIAVFVDPGEDVSALSSVCDRVELYTESYAHAYGQWRQGLLSESALEKVLSKYKATAQQATSLGIGVNAGHDLDLENLERFLTITDVLEVSIGHALTVESLHFGWATVIQRYRALCENAGSVKEV